MFFFLPLPAQEQLEKSREVISKLTDEKKSLAEQMKEKFETSERSLEDERETLMVELKRGKAAALALMQVRDSAL